MYCAEIDVGGGPETNHYMYNVYNVHINWRWCTGRVRVSSAYLRLCHALDSNPTKAFGF